MKFIRVSDEAERDLEDIWEFIALESGSISIADQLIGNLTRRFALFRQAPLAGRARPEIAPTLRSFPAGNYVIYYQIIGHRVVILRIIHSARDQSSSFASPE